MAVLNVDASTSLDALFEPRSIAVIGASSDARKIGGRPIGYLRSHGYAGAIYPINPKQDVIQGLRAHPTIEAVDGPIDQAIIAVGASAVPDAVEACIARGVRSIVLFSAGFSESGDAGARTQAAITRSCAAAGVRLLGPNCLGLASFTNGVYSTFSHSLEYGLPETGTIAMVSQSGAVGTYALVKAVKRGLRFSRFVATGNEADVDVAACIDWLATDPATEVILAYFESCRDGLRMVAALEKARAAGKPVILLKGGASEAGSAAAASHTGALAGADAVYDAAFLKTGAFRAHDLEEMLDVAYGCSSAVMPAGPRLGVVTSSGGFGVMIADAAVELGLSLPQVATAAQAEIKAELSFAAAANPVDVTLQMLNDFGLLPRIMGLMLKGAAYDMVLGFFGTMGLDEHVSKPLVAVLKQARQAHPEQTFAICMQMTEAVAQELQDAGILPFDDATRAVRALAGMAKIRRGIQRVAAKGHPLSGTTGLPAGKIDEDVARRLLADAGIPFPRVEIASSADEAWRKAAQIGGRVALKVLSAGIAHKSDVGGVALGLDGQAAVEAAYQRIMGNARLACPDARIDGVTVAQMITGGVETVIGVHSDPVFGPVVMFGLGGIHVEVMKDVSFRLAPVDEAEAGEMIRSIKGFPLLDGVRGSRRVDLDTLARAIVDVSRFGAAHAAERLSVDVNPFIALADGGVAVDALMVRSPVAVPVEGH